MKKVTFNANSAADAALAYEILNALSGVVAVDTSGSTLSAHCGDRLDSSTLLEKASRAGITLTLVDETGEAPTAIL